MLSHACISVDNTAVPLSSLRSAWLIFPFWTGKLIYFSSKSEITKQKNYKISSRLLVSIVWWKNYQIKIVCSYHIFISNITLVRFIFFSVVRHKDELSISTSVNIGEFYIIWGRCVKIVFKMSNSGNFDWWFICYQDKS